jgi:GDPmannose 4,6-dehydratase
MTKCLISGITGFVGSHLADYLLEHTDWEIYGLIRWRSPLDNIDHLIPRVNRGERVHLLYGDLRDDASLRRAVKTSDPDYVFHLAAQSYPRTSFDSPCDTLDTNVQGTVRLLEAIRHYGRNPWTHVCSSSEVYGRSFLPSIDESAPFHPASPYAVSKIGADLMAQHYAEAYGMNIVITRMFTHTGPRRGDVFMESTFAKQIAMIEAGQIPPVIKHGNLDSLRTIADVRDAVRAYHWALTCKPVRGSIYNIGGSHTCTVGELLDDLIVMSGKAPALEQDPERMRPVDADKQIANTRKFREHTGWSPHIAFETTMADLLNYWRERVHKRGYLTR